MNELQIFNNPDFGQVRSLEINGKPYFIAIDVAKSLGYSNAYDAIARHCKGVAKHEVLTNGGNQKVNIIPEGDLYRLITHSELPSAEKFETWVFDVVIPSIRKNGGYIANQENLSSEQILANAVLVAQRVIADKDKLIEELKPKAEFFDAVADSKSALPMDKVAKVLDIKKVGRNKLFEILREKKVLDRNNIPYQSFVDRGYFRVVEQKFSKPNGEIEINIKTLVYQKGIDYIRRLVA